MRYAIVTFGCRVNQADSLRIEEDLRACGGVETAASSADVVVVNTCSVTASADQGARQTIRRIAFTLRVQTGCEERCSYCIIPSTRGAGRSLPVASVVREIERIGAAGFKEVALTGVHLGSYGRDLTPRASLYDLLRALDASRN